MNPLHAMILGYQPLYQKWINRGVEIERLELQNRNLLARSERFHLAAVATEKMKGELLLKIKALEESHDGCHRRNQEQEIKELKEFTARQREVIKNQRDEITELFKRQDQLLVRLNDDETFGVRVTR